MNGSTLDRSLWSCTECGLEGLNELQALVIDYKHKKILLRLEGERWTLPDFLASTPRDDCFSNEECLHIYDWESSFEPWYVIKKLREVVGTNLAVWILRHVWRETKSFHTKKRSFECEKTVMLMECLEEVPTAVSNFQWIPLAEAKVFHLFESADAAIRKEIEWARIGSLPAKRLSWQRPGWFLQTVRWMQQVLNDSHKAQLIEPEPVIGLRCSGYGVVLEGKTNKGSFFVKCTGPFANEAAYTDELGRAVSNFVARPIAAIREKQIMIMSDFGKILNPVHDCLKAEKIAIIKDYARLQKETMSVVNELLNAGFPDFRLCALRGHLDRLVQDPLLDILKKSKAYCEYVNLFQSNISIFQEMAAELEKSNIPPTVTHNDWFFGNVYRKAGSESFMFCDWAEGLVSHPFIDMYCHREHYLEEWEQYGTSDELIKWRRIAGRIGVLIEIVQRLREADAHEDPELQECLDAVGCRLESFKDILEEYRAGEPK